jgi:hypothetical protein
MSRGAEAVAFGATREDRERHARQLRDQGLLQREIADIAGVSTSTVNAWLADPEYEKQRERRRRYAAPCEVCGGPTDGSGGRKNQRTRCMNCRTWTHESLILAVQNWADEHGGVPPRQIDMAGTHGAAVRLFGSWNELLLAAGYQLHTDRRPETMDAIIEALRAGESVRSIADRYGCTTENIYIRCGTRGLHVSELRGQGPAS